MTLKPFKPVVHYWFLWFKPVRLSKHTTNHLTLVNGAGCLLNCTACTINSVDLTPREGIPSKLHKTYTLQA